MAEFDGDENERHREQQINDHPGAAIAVGVDPQAQSCVVTGQVTDSKYTGHHINHHASVPWGIVGYQLPAYVYVLEVGMLSQHSCDVNITMS